ncbi:MAG TPA: DNA-binding response regulator [candidate division Zixibacteria bacterium]|nr:DNA-binding response regulator [candidate division Zixibacteria bacterium]
MIRILIVEDDESQRRIIEYNLKQKAYETTAVDSAEKALEVLHKASFHLLISDMKLPGKSGIELLQEAKKLYPGLPLVFITAFGTIEKAVEAMKLGAFDYITKPFDRDEFLLTIEKALEFQRLKEENQKLRSELSGHDIFSDIIGSSNVMQDIFATIKKVAATDATILIYGESGTGKELVAKAIHRSGDRCQKELVTVNCAAIPKDLLESELFGYVSGAFTGAIKDKIGKFVLADGGTIFLDEIGDLHPELQSKILRVLQERVVEPLGTNKTIAVDIRVIAATNQDLASRVRDGLFREDLFYRLNVIPIFIPPLRERLEDIPLLVDQFIHKFEGNTEINIERRALEILTRYGWPGNIRELQNIIKRVIIFTEDKIIKASDLPSEITKGENESNGTITYQDSQSALSSSEIKLITDALRNAGWNQSKAAARLGIPRHVLIYRMKKYNIKEQE